MAVAVAYPAQAAVERLNVLDASIVVLLLVILGTVADLIGVSAVVADEPSLHAMAVKRLPGARGALALKRRADRVAVVSSDIVGDIAGTVSAAAAAATALKLAAVFAWPRELAVALAIGGVAGLTVGGKAFVKGVALERANRVLYAVGYVWRWFAKSGRRGR